MFDRTRRPVVILSVAQALYLSALSVIFTFSGLVGATLAPMPSLATLPLALSTVVTAVTTIPASILMARIGRRAGFQLGALVGAAGAGFAAWGIAGSNFALFCFGNALIGVFQASAMYYRFAAADLAVPEFRPKAVSWVLAGGVAAAVVGPEVAARTRALVPAAEYMGAYLAAALLAFLSIAVLTALRAPPSALEAHASARGRPLLVIMRQPVFVVAALNAAVAYIVMSFVMTASPLAVVAAGHGVDAAAGVTRWHLVGMFAPSFFTGGLIARFGVLPILVAGGLILSTSLAIALSGAALLAFQVALLLLGVGWNFLFIGGTTLLTEAYEPAERARTQAANEFLVFGTTALATLTAGIIQTGQGWATVNFAAIPALLIAGFATAWFLAQRSRLGTREIDNGKERA